MKLNNILAVVAAVLLLLSIFSYRQSVTRAERFERGQKFLSQLNADNIQSIEVTKKDEGVSLNRDEEAFVVASAHNYPAKNESINRFINDALNISLEKEIGDGAKLEEELGLVPGSEDCTEIVFKNDAGKTMVHFLVGKTSDDGRGNFVKRLDGEESTIYLTDKGVFLSTTADSFLKKEIMDEPAAEVASIQGKDFQIQDSEGNLTLQDIPAGKQAKTSEVNQVTGALAALQYEKVYLANDATVANLNFDTNLEFQMKDESGYRLALASKDEKHYLQVKAFFEVEQIRLSQEETEEELKEKSEILSKADELKAFNDFHGSWVYELGEFAAKKFLKTKSELLEDIEKEESE